MPVVTYKRRIDKRVAGDKDQRGGWWSEKERVQAVQAYLILGKVTLVAATTGVPEDTLRKWKQQDWWAECEAEIKRGSKIELSGKLSNVVNKTLEVLEDRVVNGDFVYDRETKQYTARRPISAAVANKVSADLIDRQVLLERDTTREFQNNEGLDDRLAKLRDEMLRFANSTIIPTERTPTDEVPYREGETATEEIPVLGVDQV